MKNYIFILNECDEHKSKLSYEKKCVTTSFTSLLSSIRDGIKQNVIRYRADTASKSYELFNRDLSELCKSGLDDNSILYTLNRSLECADIEVWEDKYNNEEQTYRYSRRVVDDGSYIQELTKEERDRIGSLLQKLNNVIEEGGSIKSVEYYRKKMQLPNGYFLDFGLNSGNYYISDHKGARVI